MTWCTATLDELCDITVGRTPSRNNPALWGIDEPWLSIADMNQGTVIRGTKERISSLGAAPGKLISPGTVLLSFKLSIGKVARAGIPLYTNEAIAALPVRDSGRLDPQYLMRALQALDLAGDSNRAAMGATLNKAKLREVQIPLPPLPEQRRIAAILDHADTLRDKRKNCLRLAAELEHSSFDAAFGDPSSNRRGLPLGSIGDLVDSARYGTSQKSGSDGDIPVLRMGNITVNGQIDTTDLKYMTLAPDEVDRYTVVRGDVLFNRTNSPELVGKTAVYRGTERMAYAGYLVRVRLKEGNEPAYVAGYLNSRHGKAVLRNMCKSIVGMANINAKELQRIPILIPDTESQRTYAVAVDAIERQRDVLSEDLKSLDTLFSALQSRAFRGEL